MVVRLLGAVEIASGDGWVSAGRPKQCAILAALALQPRQLVTVRALIEATWGSRPPETAVGVVYSCVSQLRGLLRPAGASIERVSGGYRLDADPGGIDVFAARELVARARRAEDGGEPAEAVELWNQAARLWRGSPLAGVKGAWAEAVRSGLTAELQGVLVEAADAGLRLGRHRDLVEPLLRQVADHPHAEDLCVRLMLALHRSGRSPEALTQYERLRERLRDELGHEPTDASQVLHRRILRQDPELMSDDAATEPVIVPAQLPADTAVFTGRQRQLSALRAAFDRSAVVVIDGPAGVGKTALAVRLARQLADRFPDGQLFTDLHGYTGAVDPVPTATVLERLLRGLGVANSRIPEHPDERAELYRSVLAPKQVLVVLDNVYDEDQVRPLLPGDGASRVLVTSRRRLSGLDEAARVGLDRLADTDAAELFGRVSARDGAAADIAGIVSACDGLPLAVRIAAARLKARPHWTHADLLRRLRRQDRLFSELELGSRSVAAAFGVSYAALPDEARRLFCRLSLGFGADVCVHGAAALYGADVETVEPLLDELVTANLLAVDRGGRFRLHDLIRQFSQRTESEPDDAVGRRAAQDRLLRLYLYLSKAAVRLHTPGVPGVDDNPAPDDVSVPLIDSVRDAETWFRGERVNLLAAVRHAAANGDPAAAARLSLTLWPLAAWQGGPDDFAQLAEAGMPAAERQPDPLLHAEMANIMALVHMRNSDHGRAVDCFTTAIRLRDEAGESQQSANTYNNLGLVHRRLGYHWTAIDHCRKAIEIGGKPSVLATAHGNCATSYRILGRLSLARRHLAEANALSARAGDERLRVFCLGEAAAIEMAEGRPEPALRLRREAAAYYRRHDDLFGRIVSVNGAAVCLRELGRPDEALDLHREALSLFDVHHEYLYAELLIDLAATHRALGEHEPARQTYRQALDLAVNVEARAFQAQAHRGLAEVLAADGERAEQHRRSALDLCRELGLPEPSLPKGF